MKNKQNNHNRIYAMLSAYIIATVILYIATMALLVAEYNTLAICVFVAMVLLFPIFIVMLIAEKIDMAWQSKDTDKDDK